VTPCDEYDILHARYSQAEPPSEGKPEVDMHNYPFAKVSSSECPDVELEQEGRGLHLLSSTKTTLFLNQAWKEVSGEKTDE